MNQFKPGHCWVSGEPCISSHTGEPLPTRRKVTILMMDGKHIMITVHENFVDKINMNDLWYTLRCAEITQFNDTGPQSRESHRRQMALLCPPLAILHVE